MVADVRSRIDSHGADAGRLVACDAGRDVSRIAQRITARVCEAFVRNAIDARIVKSRVVGGVLSLQIQVDGQGRQMYQRALNMGGVLSNVLRRQVAYGVGVSGLLELSTVLDVQTVKVPEVHASAAGLPRDVRCVPIALTPWGRSIGPDLRQDHLLIVGATGSGKTEALRTLLYMMVKRDPEAKGFRLLIADMKHETKLKAFGAIPHLLHPIVSGNPEEVARLLRWCVVEVRRRYGLPIERRKSEPVLVLVVDEAISVIEDCPGGREALRELVQMGREANVTVILSLQYAKGVPEMFSNIMLRLVGRVAGSMAAYVNSASAGTGASELLGPGHFILTAGSAFYRCIVALVSDSELASMPVAQVPKLDFIGVGVDAVVEPVGAGRPSREISDDMLDHFRDGGTVAQFRTRFAAGSSVAKKAREVALGGNGHGGE